MRIRPEQRGQSAGNDSKSRVSGPAGPLMRRPSDQPEVLRTSSTGTGA
jgi:hypothetical protein